MGKYIDPKFDLNLERPSGKIVSYSQFSQFSKCPLSWKLSYVDKLKVRDDSIHTIFGDSMHNVIQDWLRVMYTQSIKASNELDLKTMLLDEMKRSYLKSIGVGVSNISTEELTAFYIDGSETLLWLKRHRKRYFDPRSETLIGTEVPLVISIDGVNFIAYIDAVRQNKVDKKIIIDDFKTSASGWNDWMKNDSTKTSQVLLYKIFFSQQYNVPIDQIEVQYIILKRKINVDAQFPERRVQIYKPSQGKPSYNKVKKKFDSFVKSCFLPDGSYNTLYDYTAVSGNNNNNCMFCQFDSQYELCPLEGRKQF